MSPCQPGSHSQRKPFLSLPSLPSFMDSLNLRLFLCPDGFRIVSFSVLLFVSSLATTSFPIDLSSCRIVISLDDPFQLCQSASKRAASAYPFASASTSSRASSEFELPSPTLRRNRSSAAEATAEAAAPTLRRNRSSALKTSKVVESRSSNVPRGAEAAGRRAEYVT